MYPPTAPGLGGGLSFSISALSSLVKVDIIPVEQVFGGYVCILFSAFLLSVTAHRGNGTPFLKLLLCYPLCIAPAKLGFQATSFLCFAGAKLRIIVKGRVVNLSVINHIGPPTSTPAIP